MNKRPIDVREKLSRDDFIREYLAPSRPVIIKDSMEGWPALEKWSPEYFKTVFGDMPVEVTRDDPNPVGKMPFSELYEHLREAQAAKPQPDGSISHLRYMRMRELEPLEPLRGQWRQPDFMPTSGYLIPLAPFGMDPTQKRFPGFGLFVSPKGAASKLHVDGIRSNAIVCQVHGTKRCFAMAPDQAALLPDLETRRARKLKHLDFERPTFGQAKVLEFDVNPGETLFIPRFWFHEVHTTSTSISLTYNFVHSSDTLGFAWWFLKTSITDPASHNVG
ncbi:MAG: cupin-like domain-containing protein [Myxococcaceae bacterium]|nr:cupin-like domain-containing protein [Myxococcaceae bacterium]